MAKVAAPKSVDDAARKAGLPVKKKSKGAGKRAAPTPKGERAKMAAKEEAKKTAAADKKIEAKVESTHQTRLAEASEKVDAAQVLKAAQALVKHVKLHRAKVREQRKKRDLLDDDDDDDNEEDLDLESTYTSKDIVFVNFGLKRAAPGRKLSYKMHKIPVRHPMSKLGAGRDICIFVKDKAEAEKWLATNPIPGVKKVISLQQARTQYQRFQARRDLAAMYDTFLADERIVCMLPNAIGKRSFYNTSKRPTPINMVSKGSVAGNLASRAERSVESAYFSYQGTLTSVRAALIKMDPEQIADNVMDIIAGSVPRLPGGWDNISNIQIKTGNSAPLPIYASLPSATGDKPAEEAETEDADASKKTTPQKKRKAPEADDAEEEETATKKKTRTPAKSAKKTPKAKSVKKTRKA